MIYTFYSYKGGVGRTMALANVAELFYQAGLEVLMVDWDLEAPGLERFFLENSWLESVLDKPGIMDMLLEYKEYMTQESSDSEDEGEALPLKKLDQFIEDIHPDTSDAGRLWLLPAGKRSREHFAKYARAVRAFDWQDFYQNWEGELYFEWLRRQFEQLADVVLIDSRTGVTEMGGVCTHQFADVVVMFCSANQQSLDGTHQMLLDLKRPEVEKIRGRPLSVVVVPARIENAESDLLDQFQTEFLRLFAQHTPETLGTDSDLLWRLAIPYIPRYAYKEAVAVWQKGGASSEKMVESISRLTVAISQLAPKGTPVKSVFPETEIQVGDETVVSYQIGDDIAILGKQAISLRTGKTPRPQRVKPAPSLFAHGYALLVGISAYRHLHPLEKTATDARDLSDILINQCGYPRSQVELLLDEQATRASISDKLDWLARRAGPDDTVVIFFSGHGVQRIGGFEPGEYLCPVEADWHSLRDTAISNQDLVTTLGAIRAGRIVVFLDACHAGGVGEPRDAVIQVRDGLSEQTYSQLLAGEGRVVIASCKPGEVSWELEDMRNGLFTHYLLEGLCGAAAGTDGAVRIFDLFDYLSQEVPAHAQKIDRTQVPLLKARGVTRDFAISIPSVDQVRRAESRSFAGLSPTELRENQDFLDLVSLIRRGKVIPVIGAGFSEEVGMPSTAQLLDTLQKEAMRWGAQIPSGTSLIKAASVLEESGGRATLVGTLRLKLESALRADPSPCTRGACRLLLAISDLNRLVVTTNWDDLLELAFERAAGTFEQRSLAQPRIIKLRGGFENRDEMVITEADHAGVIERVRRGAGGLWDEVATLLMQRSSIFIGYSLEDSDFDLLQRMITIQMGQQRVQPPPCFFVAPLLPEAEETILRRANAHLIPATITDFLLALFQELEVFSNQLDELDKIFKSREPFIEFHGCFNGKSALLNRAEQMAYAQGWEPDEIVRVNWDRKPDGTVRSPIKSKAEMTHVLRESVGGFEDFGDYLRRKDKVFLIFDATEHIQNQSDLVSFLSDTVAPAIAAMDKPGRRSKLLLAGRYKLRGWPHRVSKNLLSHALPPFDAFVVQDMAQRLLLATDPESWERFKPALIADILEVSSGYASFIKTILVDLTTVPISLSSRLTEEQKRGYVAQFNKEIDEHVCWQNKEQKRAYEETLCVFRWLNREIVNTLHISGMDPLRDLTAIYVLSSDDFSAALAIRRTKMFHLYYEKREQYIEAHENAREIFAKGIEVLQGRHQRDYFLEWLFHTAHLLNVGRAELEDNCKVLVAEIQNAPNYRVDPGMERGKVGEEVVRRIKEDRELCSLLETCVGIDGIVDVFEVLRHKEVVNVEQS